MTTYTAWFLTIASFGHGQDFVVGESCAELRHQLDISCPVNNGIVQNWDDMNHIWDHFFYNELKINPSECKILLIDPPLNPSKNRDSATIKCKGVDEAEVEKTVSICSKATDAKGYFFATLSKSIYDKLKLKECKAYLKSSPLEKCNVPTNVNKAIEGALLYSFRVLKDKKDKLYSVGPFF